ncbi:MAG: hypothetical protein BIFFINMI_00639 [Phycisphaerae bacterium]|nr:hypothetical protein [Phycisphaerae bacterium]
MAKRRWLQSVDLSVGDDGLPLIERYLAALSGDGLEIVRAYVSASAPAQVLVAGQPGKIAGLLLLACQTANGGGTVTLSDSDGVPLASWPSFADKTGPFIDAPLPGVGFVEAPAGKGIQIDSSCGVFGLAVGYRRAAP